MSSAGAVHPPGMIVLPLGDLTRYTDFWVSVLALQRPPGTRILPVKGTSVARNKNQAYRAFLTSGAQWVWSMGDDHVFLPDILTRLLDHQVDVVAPLCLKRKPPFQPVVYRGPGEREHFLERYTMEGLAASRGLLEVYACSTAGMLVRRRVVEAIADPWFELGQGSTDVLGEDLHFCAKLRAASIPIYVDLDVTLGHQTPMTVWPERDEAGMWWVAIDADGVRIRLAPVDGAPAA